jgi:hypothetical protein
MIPKVEIIPIEPDPVNTGVGKALLLLFSYELAPSG